MRLLVLLIITAGLAASQGLVFDNFQGIPGAIAALPGRGPVRPPSDCAADGKIVDSLTGRPIANAMISFNGGPQPQGTASDDQGKWRVTGITCGLFNASARHSGYVGSTPASGARLQLISGSALHDVEIRLVPESVITGRVLDERGEALSAAQIVVYRSMVQNGHRIMQAMQSASIDSTGNFRLGGLTTGRYIFCARSSLAVFPVGGGTAMIYPESCYPAPLSGGSALASQLDAGRELRFDFNLRPARGVTVRGTVSDNGTGFRGGSVQIRSADALNGTSRGAQLTADGFVFSNIEPGHYIIRTTVVTGGTGEAPAVAMNATTTVNVGATDVDNVSLSYQSSFPFSARIIVQQTGDQPLPPNAVNINPQPDMPDGASFLSAPKWNADRTEISWPAMSAGRYRFNASVGNRNYYVASITLGGREILDQATDINATGTIEVILRDNPGSVRGTIEDKDGKPAGGSVYLIPASGLPRTAINIQNGQFAIPGLPPGEYKAWAFDDNANVAYADEDWMRQNAGAGERVSVDAKSTATVKLVVRHAPVN